jgi:hypothetical protein
VVYVGLFLGFVKVAKSRRLFSTRRKLSGRSSVHEFLEALVLVLFGLDSGHLLESQQKPIHSFIFWNDQFGAPGAADDEGGVKGRVEYVEGADYLGRVLPGAGLRATLSEYLVTIMFEVARSLRR